MGLSVLTKFVALSGIAGAIVTATVTFGVMAPSTTVKTYKAPKIQLTSEDCYLIDTTPNSTEKLLACNNNKYYLHNSGSKLLTELQDLKTIGNSQISLKVMHKEKQTEDRVLKVTDKGWNSFPKNISLGINDKNSINGYCFLTNVIDGRDPGTFLECKDSRKYSLGLIKITQFKDEIKLN